MTQYNRTTGPGSGREALDKLEFIPKPDVFISDIMMDKTDGHEFYTQVQQLREYKNIPFIFLTAKTIQEENEKSLDKGILDYIYKPFKMNELIKKTLALLKYRQNIIESERKNYLPLFSPGKEGHPGKKDIVTFLKQSLN